jgi:phage-related protein
MNVPIENANLFKALVYSDFCCKRSIVEKAFAASGLTSDEWNDLGDDERAAKLDIALDAIADGEHQGDEDPTLETPATREELVAAYEAKFGKRSLYEVYFYGFHYESWYQY